MKIYCCACKEYVNAFLITGKTAYPHRPDLSGLHFWQCPYCENFVGCHQRWGKGEFMPLGCIATQEIKRARMELHSILDPIWQSGRVRRKKIYAKISKYLGYKYHTAQTRSIAEIELVKKFLIENYKEQQ